jgi:hypothetical protein
VGAGCAARARTAPRHVNVAGVIRFTGDALEGVDTRRGVAGGLQHGKGRAGGGFVLRGSAFRDGTRGGERGFDVAVVSGAAADVPGQPGAHLFLGGVRVVAQQPLAAINCPEVQ